MGIKNRVFPLFPGRNPGNGSLNCRKVRRKIRKISAANGSTVGRNIPIEETIDKKQIGDFFLKKTKKMGGNYEEEKVWGAKKEEAGGRPLLPRRSRKYSQESG